MCSGSVAPIRATDNIVAIAKQRDTSSNDIVANSVTGCAADEAIGGTDGSRDTAGPIPPSDSSRVDGSSVVPVRRTYEIITVTEARDISTAQVVLLRTPDQTVRSTKHPEGRPCR